MGALRQMKRETPDIPGLDIIEPLGEGGMSTVWKASDKMMDRIVAVKVLDERLAADENEIALFEAEARAMQTIDHKGFVRGYWFGEHNGLYYNEMEYVDGYDFGSLLARKQHLDESDSLLICESVAAALDYAWNEHGVVHCDIKPENIMINTDGVVKLTDLGLCHTFKFMKDGHQEVPDHVMGTPAYIAPEQVFGDVELDCRADIYELAATLYHLSTGRLLFPGLDYEEMMRAHCDEESQANDPRVYQMYLSEGFCQLLEAMLVKNRDYRVQSWQDVSAMCLDVENGASFKPRDTPGVSSIRLVRGSR
ncbi:MAG: serine/threonine protein kinase [Kiritimatiellae bacterium]|nr:serine/threonine protein kinase [Kiritimatiellia bacterium]